MNWFNNLSIKNKIYSMITVPITLMLLLASSNYYSVNSLLTTSEWVQHTEKVIGFGHELTEVVLSMETGQRGFVITGKDHFLEPYKEGKRRIEGLMVEVKQLVSDNPSQVKSLETIEGLVNKWISVAARPEIDSRKRVNQGKSSLQEVIVLIEKETGKKIMDELRKRLAEFVRVENKLDDERQKLAETSAQNAVWFIFVGTLLAILLVLFIGGKVATVISRPISQLVQAVNRVAAGDLPKSMPTSSSSSSFRDEIRELNQAFEKMTISLIEGNWLTSSLAAILGKTQGVKNFHDVANAILTKLSNLMGAGYEAFYLCEMENDEPVLNLRGVYGGQNGLDCSSRLALKESLAGQCAQDKQVILCNNVSPDLQITVGLAQTSPLAILLQPVLFEGNVMAVLEIASFQEFTETQKTLLYQLASQLGIILNSVKASVKMELLLKELQVQKEAAEAASRAKSDFLANMSHEIRTPMNAILGFLQVLSETELTEEQQGYIHTITRSGEGLLSIINDILDLSKIEAGKFDLEITQFSLPEIVQEIVSIMHVRTSEKGLKLIPCIEKDVPEYLLGDSTRLRQVLLNLVGNAIKFTNKGGSITVSVKNTSEGLLFSITDTGIGIPHERQKAIFESFSQADSSTTRQFGGTGLGLTISARIVQMMGGQLQVESEAGKGSTFFFLIKLGKGVASKENLKAKVAEIKPEDVPAINILLVEDTNDNRVLILTFLKKAPCTVEMAENGQIAVDKFKAGKFDLVLMDMQMPVMDGYIATRTIRAWEKEQDVKPTRIVALTAHALKRDSEKSLRAGCNSHLTKPIKKQGLFKAIVENAALIKK